jgi:Flp pilus assembly protein TadD
MAKKPSTDDRRREQAGEVFAKLMRALHKQEPEKAREALATLESDFADVADVLERARTLCSDAGRPSGRGGRPRNTQEQMIVATLALNRDDLDSAEKEIDSVLSAAPKHAGARYLRAVVLARRGDAGAAATALKAAIAVAPEKRVQASVDGEFEAVRRDPAFETVLAAA